MPRSLPSIRLAACLVLAVAITALPARAEDEGEQPKASIAFQDLDKKTQKEVAEVVSAYLDPEVEFLWRPRKDFIGVVATVEEEAGVNALVDIGLMRQMVYEGRHFLQRFSDKKWQREKEITEFKSDGPYENLVSERYRFSYVVPRSYPKERAFSKLPRTKIEPYPLLLSIHEEQDTKDARMRAEKYPGGAALKRRFPKDDYEDLYDTWLMLAPVAARAKFLEDGAIRHRFLTQVLSDFWRRYHVDFDRIVVDGAAPAAALAAAFPHVFAGVVLRPGDEMALETETVRNFATVPAYVVDDAKLGKQLEEAGHGDVTVGSAKDLPAWLNERRRAIPKKFSWSMLRPDHTYANWMVITGPDYAAPERTLDVEVIDTEEHPNTIQIVAKGMEHIRIFLSDEVVDLGREVRLLVNGEEKVLGKIERDFGRLFEKDPEVRRNMNFGWLFTAVVEDVSVPAPAAEEKPPEGTTEPAPEEGPKGSPEDEEKAADLWEKAEEAVADGEMTRARLYLNKIVELGETSWLAKAKARLEELSS